MHMATILKKNDSQTIDGTVSRQLIYQKMSESMTEFMTRVSEDARQHIRLEVNESIVIEYICIG